MDDLEIHFNELTENPSARVPVCLCLDTSGSMEGEPIDELNEGLRQFFYEVRENKAARYSADICIISFGASIQRVVDFRQVDKQIPPRLRAFGTTPMGGAVQLALDSLDQRKRMYQRVGVDYHQPWLVVMTDGLPSDSVDQPLAEVTRLVAARKLTVMPIAVGPEADLAMLGRFTPGRPALRMQGLKFREFFAWLSKSMVRISSTSVGETVAPLPTRSWDSLA